MSKRGSGGHDASEDGTVRRVIANTADMGSGYRLNFDGSYITSEGHDQPAKNKEPLIGGVRRLTPAECCRLQGFPDDWLGEPNERPDSPRYAAMKDAVTVNVAEWIGERLHFIGAECSETK